MKLIIPGYPVRFRHSYHASMDHHRPSTHDPSLMHPTDPLIQPADPLIHPANPHSHTHSMEAHLHSEDPLLSDPLLHDDNDDDDPLLREAAAHLQATLEHQHSSHLDPHLQSAEAHLHSAEAHMHHAIEGEEGLHPADKNSGGVGTCRGGIRDSSVQAGSRELPKIIHYPGGSLSGRSTNNYFDINCIN